MFSKLKFKLPSDFKDEDLSWMVDVLSQVQSGISIADAQKPDLPLIFVNKAFEEMTGYKASEVVGKNCRFLQGDQREQPARYALQKAVREGQSCDVILKNYTKEGKLFFNRLVLSPVRDGEGKLTHFIGIQHNITPQLQKEADIANQRHLNERLSKLATLGELSSSIVHEINSPMMVLFAQLEMMRDLIKEPADYQKLSTHLDKAEAAISRVTNIIKSLRGFSHDSHDSALERRDLAEIIEESLELCLCRVKGTAIKLDCHPPAGKFFSKLHPVQFSQVLVNLFNNAVDAIGGEKGEIKIILRQREGFNDLCLYDSGPGVPLTIQEKMFESFFTTKGFQKGTGLGLSLSKKFMHKMHGDVTYHEEGGEHYFRVSLPQSN